MGYSGAGGKLIHEKNQKQKISWHCRFKGLKKMDTPGNLVASPTHRCAESIFECEYLREFEAKIGVLSLLDSFESILDTVTTLGQNSSRWAGMVAHFSGGEEKGILECIVIE